MTVVFSLSSHDRDKWDICSFLVRFLFLRDDDPGPDIHPERRGKEETNHLFVLAYQYR